MARRFRNKGQWLRMLGFDRSWYGRSDRHWHVRCSQCEAHVVNGVPIHERGCPHELTTEKKGEDE